MKPQKLNQDGFLPMLITVLIIVLAAIYFVFTRVLNAKGGLHL